MTVPQIYLASQSPRRWALIEQMGVRYQALDVVIDECPQPGETPAAFVARLASEKAQTGWRMVAEHSVPVIGADTCIVLDRQIIGKPETREQGIQLLKHYSGRSHQVLTGIAIVGPETGKHGAAVVQHIRVNTSVVTFRVLSDYECEQYWQTGEPVGKAGGYAIQGRAAAFIAKLEGSYSAVMGLPLFEFAELIALFGIGIFGAQRPHTQETEE
ncbi:MAG: Maf family nucleotide pyrophosphatase [Gammaproteobacteria bacterium]|nr:Maf family nucleotide pyrophosphatase [Gammaproteobacteria bacterium]